MLPLQWRDGRAQSNIVVRASLSMSVCHVLSGEITLWSCPIEVHVPEGHMTGSVSEHVSLPRMCRVGTGGRASDGVWQGSQGPQTCEARWITYTLSDLAQHGWEVPISRPGHRFTLQQCTCGGETKGATLAICSGVRLSTIADKQESLYS